LHVLSRVVPVLTCSLPFVGQIGEISRCSGWIKRDAHASVVGSLVPESAGAVNDSQDLNAIIVKPVDHPIITYENLAEVREPFFVDRGIRARETAQSADGFP
jgi:hypothetical protein